MKDYFDYTETLLDLKAQEMANNLDRDRDKKSLAMAYVPMQKFRDLYSAEEGFPKGTIFKELDKPFEGWRNPR
jgi:hypothetical protein